MTEHSAPVAGRRQVWIDEGAADPPLVLLHCIGSGAPSWAPVLPALAAHRRVIAWNLPGYGGADCLADPHAGPADHAAALLGFLDHLGIARCDLLGHSLGGLLAAHVARHFPARVNRLVLSSPAGGYRVAPGAELPPALAARIEDVRDLGPVGMADKRAANMVGPDTDPAILERVRATMAAVDPLGYAAAVWLLAQGDVAGWAPGITAPTLVMVGTADRVTKPDGVAALAALVPGATQRQIAGAGHASYADHAAEYAAEVNRFLG